MYCGSKKGGPRGMGRSGYTSTSEETNLERWVQSFIGFLFSVATVWFWAWLAKPNIDSGLVWLLAFIYASLANPWEFRRQY